MGPKPCHEGLAGLQICRWQIRGRAGNGAIGDGVGINRAKVGKLGLLKLESGGFFKPVEKQRRCSPKAVGGM